jgi:peptide/nickel transport system substrate-binding protein
MNTVSLARREPPYTPQQRRPSMTRTRILALSFLLLLFAMPAVTDSGWAQAKPDLTVALSSFATETLDPVLAGHLVKYYLSMMFDYVVGTTPDGQLSKDGGLATRWENSADHKRWTFYLRKGVKFHNGDDVTSEDVKFSLQRAAGKRSTTGYAGILRTLVQDIETPAPDRLVIVTKEPTLVIPTSLSRSLSTEGMVLPKKYIEQNGDDAFARKPVGSGPYRFVEQISGSHIKLAAVDSHWRIGAPKYKSMIFRIVPEETTRIALLRRGEVDVAEISRERVAEVEREGFPVHFRREEAILSMWWILAPDGWPAPMKDKRVREAMNVAIDRNELAQSIFAGRAEPAAIPAGLSWSFKEIGLKVTPEMQYPYDPARAKKLLADAGVGGGFNLDVYAYQLPGLPEGKAFAEAVAGYWDKIGIKTKLIPVDYPAFRKNWVDRKTPGAVGYFNIANRDWIGTYAFLEKQAYSPSKANDTVHDPEVDAMIAQVVRQTDREKINALMRNIYTRMRSEHSGMPIVYLHSPYAASKKLGKWNPGSVMYDLFFDELASGK